jgi:hypothetical protein
LSASEGINNSPNANRRAPAVPAKRPSQNQRPFFVFLSSDFSGMQHTYLIGTNGWRMCDRRSASGTASACYKVSQKNLAQMKNVWKSKAENNLALTLSARHADEILDHLALMVRRTARGSGRISRIQGMDLNYWVDRINTVINKTDLFSSQQERAKLLLIELRSSDRA